MDWISILATSLTFTGVNLQTINKLIKKWRSRNKKVEDITYQNDDFARITIKYRFNNTFCDLNDKYEDAVIALKKNNSKVIRPFNYTEFYNGAGVTDPVEFFKNLPMLPGNYMTKVLQKPQDVDLKDEKYENNKDFIEHAPFINVEHFFYYYILLKFEQLDSDVREYIEDSKYLYDHGISSSVHDPYKLFKKKSIEDDINNSEESIILNALNQVFRLEKVKDFSANDNEDDLLQKIIVLSLQSNSYDLSQLHSTGRYVLKNDNYEISGANEMIDFLGKEVRTVHYLVDNSGVELLLDLVLGYALLNIKHLRIDKIVYHVNVLPIFVSDVIENDKDYTLRVIEDCITKSKLIDPKDKSRYVEALEYLRSMFIKDSMGRSRAEIRPDFVWNMPTPYEEIAEDHSDLFRNRKNILIVKGDLNYRRLCGDKSWRSSKKLDNLTKYITTPTLVIRCFKSNVILDVKDSQIEAWDKKDMDWRVNGNYGVIKFMSKEKRHHKRK